MCKNHIFNITASVVCIIGSHTQSNWYKIEILEFVYKFILEINLLSPIYFITTDRLNLKLYLTHLVTLLHKTP